MSLLYQKLKDKYGNSDDLINVIERYNLHDILIKAINNIETKLENIELTSLINISGIVLTQVNSVLSSIQNQDDKRQLEYLIADIFDDYLKLVYAQPNSEEIINGIVENLRLVCEYNGYDFEVLHRMLNIEKHEFLLPRQPTKNVYYEWLKTQQELDDITKDLAASKIIYSIKEFKSLFKENRGNTKVRFYREKKAEVIILFQVMKELKLAKPKGKGNSGHFAPFVEYAVDNENNFFIENAIFREHDKLKRTKDKYLNIKEKMQNLLKMNLKRIKITGG